MLKKVLCVWMAVILGTSLFAKADLKIATVDFQKALLNTEEGKSTKVKLEEEAKGIRTKLETQAQELKKMEEEMQGLATSVLSDAAKAKKGQEFQQKVMEFKQEEQKQTTTMQQREQEEVQKVFRKLKLVTKDWAQKNQFDLVMEANSSGLLYAEKITDITDDIIVEYDKQNKISKDKK